MGASAQRVPIDVRLQQDFGAVDYADAFELHTVHPDSRTAGEWLRAGLEDSPAPLRRLILVVHRHALRFRLGPHSGDGYVLGWHVIKEEPDEMRLEAAGPLFSGRLVGRRPDPSTVRLDTLLTFNRPRTASIVWAVVGPLHRAVAPFLLQRASGRP
jgi:hypothetical protein